MDQKDKKDKKDKKNDPLIEIKSKGWEAQHSQLVSKGFTDPKTNLKILIKFDGNVANCLAKLEEKDKPKGKHLLDDEYSKQCLLLVAAGFQDQKQNLKALHKTNGDLEQAKALLKAKESDPKQKEKNQLSLQAKELVKQGFPNEEANYKALKKTDGNLEQAKLQLQKSDKKSKEKISITQQYFIDGSNLVFCLEDVRSLYLKQKEDAIKQLIERILKKISNQKPQRIVIVFDQTSQSGEKDIEGIKVLVMSSKDLKFASAGDCLVDLTKGANEQSLFITSDKNLKERLKQFKVLKSVDFASGL